MFNQALQSPPPRQHASPLAPSKRGGGGITVVVVGTPEELGEVIEVSGKRLPHQDRAELRRLGDGRRDTAGGR